MLLRTFFQSGDHLLPPRSRWDLRSSGILRSAWWQFLIDVSDQEIQNCVTLEDGTNRLSRNVGKELPAHAALFFQKRADRIPSVVYVST